MTESDGRRYKDRMPEYACLACGERYYVGEELPPDPDRDGKPTRRRRQPSHGTVRL